METKNANQDTKPDERIYSRKVRSFGKKTKAITLVLMISTVGLSFFFATFDIVDSGKVRIAVQPDGTIVGPVDAGWHIMWCHPFSKKYDFQITAQSVILTGLHADTLDGHVNIDLTVSYLLSKDNVIDLFSKYGANYQTFIEAVITSAFRNAFSKNTMRDVALENRTTVQTQCRDRIEEGLHEYFIELLSLLVQNIALPTAFSDAQIQTQIAYEQLRAANISREIQLLNATTASEVSIINSYALANATIIEAQGLADSLDIVIDELNVTGNLNETHVLTYLWIQAITDFGQYGNVILITDGETPFIVDVAG